MDSVTYCDHFMYLNSHKDKYKFTNIWLCIQGLILLTENTDNTHSTKVIGSIDR